VARPRRPDAAPLAERSRHQLGDLRCALAADLLAGTNYKIDDIARLSGYSSASAFAKVFREEYKISPSEYRRAKKGPARAGGPTGAFARNALAWRPGIETGAYAVCRQRMDEARARIEDRSWLESFGQNLEWAGELFAEMKSPRHLRDDPEHWHERHQALADWIDANERRRTVAAGSVLDALTLTADPLVD